MATEEFDCKGCNLRGMHRMAKICGLSPEVEQAVIDVTEEAMAEFPGKGIKLGFTTELWKRIAPVLGTDDPYRDVKRHYNDLVLSGEDDCERAVAAADDPFQLALRFSAAGNLIDFTPGHPFDEQAVKDLVARTPQIDFAIDDSASLHEAVRDARSVMILADNCGEIVLDKVLARQIRRERPGCEVIYVVRGGAVLNDVTMEDARQVGMDEVARVMSSGIAAPNTFPDRSSEEFRRAFFDADVIIAKGMGNFESLWQLWQRPGIWYLLMTKCEKVSRLAGCELMSLVCKRGLDERPVAAS